MSREETGIRHLGKLCTGAAEAAAGRHSVVFEGPPHALCGRLRGDLGARAGHRTHFASGGNKRCRRAYRFASANIVWARARFLAMPR